MPNKCETKNSLFQTSFETPNPSLRSYFGRVVQGQPDVYRTTFYKGRDVTEILDQWMPHLEVLKNEWPTLWDFENDLAKKVGPMSVMKPLKDRIPDIDSYYESILKDSKPIPKSALDAVIKEWGSARGMRIRSEGRTVELMKKSTNSGSPYFRKRRDVLNATVPSKVSYTGRDEILQNLPQFTGTCAAVLGWRGQEGGPKPEDVKQRVVWMFPFAVNIQELRLYQVLIETAQKFNLVPAWVSMEAVDAAITRLFDTKGKNDLIVCTDFSKFDQHFNEQMSSAAETILRELFTADSEAISWFSNVFPIKYTIPLAYDYGKVRVGKHGMGSGSGGTNADETLTHRALQYEAAQSVGATLNPNSMCLGDDGILSYPGINVEDVTRIYSSHGQDMNLDKQYASTEDCTYLRRWHHTRYRMNGVCVGVYSTTRALGRLAEQERYYDPETWGKEMVALRQLSILENIKYHPLREEFVDYCMKGDKFRLGLDIPGFLDNIEGVAKKATDHMPDFLGYTKSMQKGAETGISEWWIVKYLKSKA
nr:MAG: RNA-dependent RNA polymerase [Porcine picobirnavirus]